MFNSIIIIVIFGSVCELHARPCGYKHFLARNQYDSAIDSFVENSENYGAINTNKNSPVQLDVNGVISKAIRPLSMASYVGIPPVSMIDQSHTGSDRFQISARRSKHDGFDDMIHEDEGLIAQPIAELAKSLSAEALGILGLQPTNNVINLFDRLQ